MRYIVILLLLSLLQYGHFNANGNLHSKEFNLANRLTDTIKPENIFECILEIGDEAQPNQDEWVEFLQNNLQLDSAAIDTIPTGKFTVFAQFAIDAKGKLGEVVIIRDPGYGLGERVKKVLNNYGGCWQPAIINGRETKSYRKQPITFVVEEQEENICEEKLLPELIL